MQIIKKQLILSPFDYFSTHLKIINPLLPVHLTPKEIELLANFMMLNGSISEDRFGSTGKKIIMNKMNIGPAGISNYLRSLKQKGFISGNDILSVLYPENEQQGYNFKLIKNEK